jgi:bacillopeptidase F (M6 metalloprotease family)
VVRPGGYDDAEDEISKKIQIQEGKRIFYRVWVEKEERASESWPRRAPYGRSWEAARHRSEPHIDAVAEKADEDGWIEDSVDLSRFAGTTVKVSYLAKTNEEQRTTFYVDEVTLE